MSPLPSDLIYILKSSLTTPLAIHPNNQVTPSKSVTFQDIINCNSGFTKFGNKVFVRYKNGVWLNAEEMLNLFNNPKNHPKIVTMIIKLNNLGFTTLIQTPDSRKIFQPNALGPSPAHLIKTRKLANRMNTMLTAQTQLHPELKKTAFGEIADSTSTFYSRASFPDAISVILSINSQLFLEFITFLAMETNGYEICSLDELYAAYELFVTLKTFPYLQNINQSAPVNQKVQLCTPSVLDNKSKKQKTITSALKKLNEMVKVLKTPPQFE